jgi:hypothetical protein
MNSMSRKLRSLLALALTLACPSLYAAPQGEAEARRMAAGWLRVSESAPLHERLGSLSEAAEAITVNGQTVGYVFSLSPSGFIITSADDSVEPVIAFSKSGRDATASGSPLDTLLRGDLPRRLSFAATRRTTQALKISEVTRKWALFSEAALDDGVSTLGNNGLADPPADLRIAPLLSSRWGQTTAGGQPCYNYYTPSNYPCGCIGTAWGQVMRYHQYPTNGIGQLTRIVRVDGVLQTELTLGGDGLGGPYAWSQMPYAPNASSSEAQRQAIGALTHDIVVAISSNSATSLISEYSHSGTGSYMPPTAMTTTFGYASTLRFNSSVNQTNAINANLDAGSPVVIAVSNSVGGVGHAVICDGYGFQSATAYHHVNMGWDGQQDAWYNIREIQGDGYDYVGVDWIYANIFPDKAGEIVSGRVLDESGKALQGVTVTLSPGDLTATSDSAGIYAFRGVASGSAVTLTAAIGGYSFAAMNVTLGTSSGLTSTSGNRWGNDFTGIKDISYHVVSGRITSAGKGYGIANILVVFSNGAGSTRTDGNGDFSKTLPEHWAGTITPTHPTGSFQPAAYALSDLLGPTSGIDFLATLMCLVDVDARGAGDGSTWADAYTNLVSALSDTPTDREIWVADGTYKPGNTRDSAFFFYPGQAVYGGFSGTETRRDQRDWCKNISVLSGEIGSMNTVTDNCYNVVHGALGARMDGFTITGGNADYAVTSGLLSVIARGFGGGVFIYDYPSTEAASFLVDHCIVTGNRANNDRNKNDPDAHGVGGGLFRCLARNTLLYSNVAEIGSATYYCILENCTVVSNTATYVHDPDYDFAVSASSSGAVTNCIVYHNKGANVDSVDTGDLDYWVPGLKTGTSCFPVPAWFNTYYGPYPGVGNITAAPKLVNTAACRYLIATNSPCKNAGVSKAWMTGSQDYFGDSRVSGTAPDMGAYELQATHPVYAQQPGSPLLGATAFNVKVPTRYGWSYRLQYRASLTSGTWQNVSGATATGDGTVKTLTDTAATAGQRFYRVTAQ